MSKEIGKLCDQVRETSYAIHVFHGKPLKTGTIAFPVQIEFKPRARISFRGRL